MPLITTITDRGRQILAARVPGDPPLASIKIAVGDGNGNVPTPSNAQVALVNERWRGAGEAAVNGPKIGFTVTIPANIGGWTIREIGVFVGTPGAEELLVVSQFGPQYKPAMGENGASTLKPVVGIDYTGSVVGAFTITLDESLSPADPSVHRTVNGRVAIPPALPVDGSVYAISAGASGDFAGKAGQIAKRRGSAWIYETPLDGHIVREQGTSGAFWQKAGSDYVSVTFPISAHHHDERYFLKTETNALLAAKSDQGHHHDERYYREDEMDILLASRLSLAGGTMTGNLGIENASPHLRLGRPGAGGTALISQIANVTRWLFEFPNSANHLNMLRLDASGNLTDVPWTVRGDSGRVGINMTDPQARLDINGDVLIRNMLRVWHASGARLEFASDGGLEITRTGGGAFIDLKDNSGEDFDSRLSRVADGVAFQGGGLQFENFLRANGNVGSGLHVLTGGSTASWKTLAELGLGVVPKAVAGDVAATLNPSTYGTHAVALQRGFSSAVHIKDTAHSRWREDFVFSTPAANANYLLMGWIEADTGTLAIDPAIHVTNKTATGFTLVSNPMLADSSARRAFNFMVIE